MNTYIDLFGKELDLIERHLSTLLNERFTAPVNGLNPFWECMNYSLLSEGKRFRPLLSLLTAKTLEKPMLSALPMATAVELIHTYSLIHDDLPVMDDDDERRGRPTNHKVYGDAMALLAGDALLTLAFGVLADSGSPNIGAAVRQLSEAAGPRGMVGGQVLDIKGGNLPENALADIHARKTGALIRVAVEGTAILLEASTPQTQALARYGDNLGLAFQLADDLQDGDGYVTLLGEAETKKRLQQVSEQALQALTGFGESASGLRNMIQYNLKRV